MSIDSPADAENLELAHRWCEDKGSGWSPIGDLGKGGTAPVFEVASPYGLRALKIYDDEFSTGPKGEIEARRIEQTLSLCSHDCQYLVQVHEGGRFKDRLYLLMERASGQELEKRLHDVPRNKIRQIVDQVAQAAIFLRERNLCHRDIKAANVFISDDFEHATLLDISVIRDIHDPVGVGTDHDGELPVVATARYSPPEYLFRLVEPGPNLWHALNIYQLGALLHDLIMKESLFESEYSKSLTNRYRFAWLVATATPKIKAEDVEQDLVFTARRGLDKDWQQRSTLRLEDFLADSNTQQAHALRFIGVASEQDALATIGDIGLRLKRVRDVVNNLEVAISERLRRKGATSEHVVENGNDDSSKLIRFRWNTSVTDGDETFLAMELQVRLTLQPQFGRMWFKGSATLQGSINAEPRMVELDLPDVEDEPGAESFLAEQVESALAVLAVEFIRPQSKP